MEESSLYVVLLYEEPLETLLEESSPLSGLLYEEPLARFRRVLALEWSFFMQSHWPLLEDSSPLRGPSLWRELNADTAVFVRESVCF